MAIFCAIPVKAGVDTTKDTITAETLLEGVTAHDASGAPITGTLKITKSTAFVPNIVLVSACVPITKAVVEE